MMIMRNDFVTLCVRGVAVAADDASSLVVLEDESRGRRLAVPVGPTEASAIILELEGVSPPRPHTHDLFAALFREHGFELECAELSEGKDLGGECFRARIVYRKGLRRWSMDARPSDALALALKLKGRIVVSGRLLGKGGEFDSMLGRACKDSRFYYIEARDAQAPAELRSQG